MNIKSIKEFFAPLKIIEIEDSGSNGIIFKALEHGKTRALKVLYSFSANTNVLAEKVAAEYKITKRLNGIQGLPRAHKLYIEKKDNGLVEPFSCKGFDFKSAKQQIIHNRSAYESDSSKDILFAGAFTMDFMDFFSKLPKEMTKNLPYELPPRFFKKLEHVANEMLKRGYSLPPESDIGFDTDLNPILVDFAGCISLEQLVRAGRPKRAMITYIKNYNASKIEILKDCYQKQTK